MKHSMRIPLAAILCASMGSVVADEKAQTYNIPAQSLHSALQTLADQAGVAVFFSENQVTGKTSPTLNGQYSPREALQKLLAGSGLTYTFTAEDSVSIRAVASGSDAGSTLPAVKVLGKAVYDPNDPYNKDYVIRDSSTATKTDTPIMETPVNIQIIPKAVLNDQQAITLDSALKNVAGVTTGAGSGGTSDDIYLRGFRNPLTYRNGFRIDSKFSSWGKREMSNVERVEVVKGPAAILYGQMEPGGMVNVVTKQPLSTPYYSAQQQFGSFDLYRTTIDATGPVTKDDKLLYRINAAYENSGSYRELVNNERVFLAPVLKWNISARTQVTFEMEYRHDNLVNDSMVWPYVNGQFINIPRSRNLMEKTPANVDDIFLGLNWSHQFNDDWMISNRFSTQRRESPNSLAMFGTGMTGSTLQRLIAAQPEEINTYYATLDLTGHINTFGLKHTLLLGGDYNNSHFISKYYFGNMAAPIDVYSPIHTGYSFPVGYADINNKTDYYGLYAQDQIKLPYNIQIMGGLRYQVVSQANLANQTSFSNDAVTPRVGVLWQPQKWLSLYSNYVENFGASNGIGQAGKVLPPESAQQWEVGAKTEFFDGKLSATLAYFDLTKQNVATTDPSNPLYQIAVGAVRSRGPELDIRGELMTGWNVIATYANLDTIITKDNSGRQGLHLYAVPRNVGTFWNTYDFQSATLKGLKVGAGLNMRDSTFNFDNSYKVPGFATVDLLAAYEIKLNKSNVTFQLNVNNLLDKGYLQDVIEPLSAGAGTRVNIGAPRSLLGSVKIEF
ncbi:TonB-dependent siderophore receptor [Methylomonas methanica]|uniref:TonB-dependent siderophore receptor n=1 Tax=Methylomonas methanica (strain DSM 25384 / MC09) TaxID=857087 RepID=G0A2Z4_METMM|nr:TonB-dependent receptor [Methylomonas methanica]AEG02653.1 TonB-dependent siderophore receptor [Methylomonas methanica MC09]